MNCDVPPSLSTLSIAAGLCGPEEDWPDLSCLCYYYLNDLTIASLQLLLTVSTKAIAITKQGVLIVVTFPYLGSDMLER